MYFFLSCSMSFVIFQPLSLNFGPVPKEKNISSEIYNCDLKNAASGFIVFVQIIDHSECIGSYSLSRKLTNAIAYCK